MIQEIQDARLLATARRRLQEMPDGEEKDGLHEVLGFVDRSVPDDTAQLTRAVRSGALPYGNHLAFRRLLLERLR
jgi:hypothetical protein